MNLEDAIQQACASVGIVPPRDRKFGRWLNTDTLSGRNGKGDGRLMLDEDRVSAFNWQTGETQTVWLKDQWTPEDKRRFAEQRAKDRKAEQDRAASAAQIAQQLMYAATPATHPYLARKGFPAESVLVIEAAGVAHIGGAYLVQGEKAIVVPARIGKALTSVQLIWEDGTKKFLFGGEMGGATHRIASGSDTWLCEGFATGLSLRTALKGLNRSDTILVAFSASNIAKVAPHIRGRCFIAADHDAPPKAKPDQFGGLGAGEFFARQTGRPYLMPADEGMDVNDVHSKQGVFAAQRLITDMIRRLG